MRPVLAIARLTFKAAVRFRLVLVLGLLLFALVIVLPAVVKHDGTARGLAQIVLTYTLSLTTAILGFVTLWLGCGMLAREIDECQLQLVTVKPVARWQVWTGKWLGIMSLNLVLLSLAGGAVAGLLMWRAEQLPTTPVNQRALLLNQVLVARESVRETLPDLDAETGRMLKERLAGRSAEALDTAVMRQRLSEEVRSQFEVVPPGAVRAWVLDLSRGEGHWRPRPVQLRFKFFTSERALTGTYPLNWRVGPPDGAPRELDLGTLAAETFHEVEIPAEAINARGQLRVECRNVNRFSVVFPLADGMEALQREAGFAVNFARGLAIVFCWLGMLAALGLAASGAFSFPVAAFVCLAALLVVFSTGSISGVVERGSIMEADHETGKIAPSWADKVALPVFRALLATLNVVRGYSPIDALSSGRSVTWAEVAGALIQVLGVMGGLVAAGGIAIFARRELAAAGGRS
jgi:hypothetical protein